MQSDTRIESKVKRFESAALAHLNSLYRFALSRTGNKSDAEDLLQDTYLRAYRFFDKFREGTDCRAWLFKIMRNTHINNIIRSQRRKERIAHLSEMEGYSREFSTDINPEDEVIGNCLMTRWRML